MKRSFRIGKAGLITLTIIIIILVAVRLVLPYYVKNIINKQLSDIAPYSGHVDDVDLMLITGAYRLNGLEIVMRDADQDVPFLSVPRTDLSVEWRALLHGRIVGEVEISQPEVNFVFAKSYEQTGTELNWMKLVKDMIPISINRFQVVDGKVGATYIREDITIESQFQNFDLEITNIRNVTDANNALPSRIYATAESPMYKGNFKFEAQANLLRLIPDMDYDAEIENIELVSLNPMMKHFTNMDFEGGTLDLYSEMIVSDGTLDGYVKPILTDAMIYKGKEEDRNFLEGVKEFVAEGVQEIFQNRSVNTTASKIPITGSVEDMQTAFWPSVIAMIKNAYWQAILKRIDDTIKYEPERVKRRNN